MLVKKTQKLDTIADEIRKNVLFVEFRPVKLRNKPFGPSINAK
jgi:hypothetical protein